MCVLYKIKSDPLKNMGVRVKNSLKNGQLLLAL
jgi:hypothetical protein